MWVWLLLVATALAQIQFDPIPSPPVTPRRPPIIFPPGGSPLDPAGPMAVPRAGSLSATAVFDPPVLKLMRFGEFRVTVLGAASGIDIPDPLPAPDGLILDLVRKEPGVQMLDGQRVMAMTYYYTVTAARAGTFVVPSFTLHASGTAVTVPATQLVAQEPTPGDLPYQSATAVLDLAPGEYYVGQMLPARLLVFDTPDETVQAIANVAKPAGDFLFQSQNGSRRERIVWQGRPANALVTPLRLTPIKPGESEISLQAIVFVAKNNAVGRLSGNTAQTMLDTPPVKVSVRPLPESGRRPGFTGAIGQFTLGQPTLSTPEVIVGDPVTLTVTITGEGNLEGIGAPPLESSEAWQAFTTTAEVEREVFSARGTKKFTYTLIPRRADLRSLPVIPFAYFDPERREYLDLSVPPQAIVVKPDPNAAPPPAPVEMAASDTKAEPPMANPPERILTGLAEKPGRWRRSPSPVWSAPIFWFAQAIPAVALLGLWGWRRRVDYLAAHPEIVRRREARAAARHYLRAARSAAGKKDAEKFLAASLAAIRAAAAPLDTTQPESLVLEEVLAKLPSERTESGAAATVRELFTRAHAAHFSGHPVEPNGVLTLLPKVESAVREIERAQP
jgi:hypothetical protein